MTKVETIVKIYHYLTFCAEFENYEITGNWRIVDDGMKKVMKVEVQFNMRDRYNVFNWRKFQFEEEIKKYSHKEYISEDDIKFITVYSNTCGG